MAIELKMPALSPTMEKGTLAKWLVKEGDMVRPGDLIAEIETDKATMELEAVDEGRIASLVVADGTDGVPVGAVIALIAESDENVAAALLEPLSAVPAAEASQVMAPVSSAAPAAAAVEVVKPKHLTLDNNSVNATPLARRIAIVNQLSLLGIVGSGARGRIVKADIMPPQPPALIHVATATSNVAVLDYSPPAGVPVESVKLSTMRRTIARRLTESKQTIPHFYLTVRCNLDPLIKLRNELNTSLETRGIKLSINDMLIKAMALALTAVPDANVQYGREELHRYSRVDIAMAVAIDGGLVTPVIKDAASLSVSAIGQLSKSLATKARDGKLAPEDYQGGTASISNLGMFGIDEMFPVINPPQALILGIGAGVEQPWKVDGEIALATIMATTASFDHRAIDGACAAQFMAAFRDFVEDPYLLVI